MKQQMLEAQIKRMEIELQSLRTDRDDWKTLAQLHMPEPSVGPDPMEEALALPLGQTVDMSEGPGKVDYNGWTNRETWQASLFIGPQMDAMAAEGEPYSPDEVQDLIDEELPILPQGSLIENIVMDWLMHVNKEELAKKAGWVED